MSSPKAPTGLTKERAIRRRQLKWLWGRLKQLAGMKAQSRRGADAARCRAQASPDGLASHRQSRVAADSAALSYRLDREKLRRARRREGRYLLRTTSHLD